MTSTGQGREGVKLMKERAADCVILDLMLPDINGYQVCEEIRAFNQVVPIIMLTARGQEGDKIRGLEVGADDYVTKPFSVGELLARIKAIFRRLHKSLPADEEIQIGPSLVNLKKHTALRSRRSHPLSFYEVELLKLLWERKEQPVSRDGRSSTRSGARRLSLQPHGRQLHRQAARKKLEDERERAASHH